MATINTTHAKALQDWNSFHQGLVYFPHAREASGCFLDVNSVARNGASSLRSLAAIPAVAAAINGSAIAAGVLGVPVGLSILRDSYKRGKFALSCGHNEGAVQSALMASIGVNFAGISGLLGTEGIMGVLGASLPVWFPFAFLAAGGGMYAALGIYAANGLRKTSQFATELKQQKENGTENTIRWLYDQVSIKPGETEKDLKKKWSAFELRTDAACVQRVLDEAPQLLKNFDEKKAEDLIEAVEKANFKQQIKYALFILITLLGIATLVAMALTTGPLSPILFAIGAVFWLAIDSSKLHNYIGEKCWTWHRGEKSPVLPCENLLTA